MSGRTKKPKEQLEDLHIQVPLDVMEALKQLLQRRQKAQPYISHTFSSVAREVVRAGVAPAEELELARAVVLAARVMIMVSLDNGTTDEKTMKVVKPEAAKELWNALKAYDKLGQPPHCNNGLQCLMGDDCPIKSCICICVGCRP